MNRFLTWFFLLSILIISSGCISVSDEKGEVAPLSSDKVEASYEIAFEKEYFQVREHYLGAVEGWDWKNFEMPTSRIDDPVSDLGLDSLSPPEKYSNCVAQLDATGWCIETVQFTTSEGKINSFSLRKDHILMVGNFKLEKNNQVLWEGELQASTEGPILSSKQIGDELAIEYVDIPNAKSENLVHSILLTNGDTVIDLLKTTSFHAVFAPNDIRGQLIYFAKVYTPEVRTSLIFEGSSVTEYDSVFNQKCCWDGPSIQIIGNGQIIDFFARRKDGWYHVQAGYFEK